MPERARSSQSASESDALLTLQDAKALYKALTDLTNALSGVRVEGLPKAEDRFEDALAEAVVLTEALEENYAKRAPIGGSCWNARVGGPITEALPVDVVPCNDAAIERATSRARMVAAPWLDDMSDSLLRLVIESALAGPNACVCGHPERHA